jgi:hypothetical protein
MPTPWKPGGSFDEWWAEVFAEKVDVVDLAEEHALRIGQQILRENALKLFPQLKDRLWKHKGAMELAPSPTTTTPVRVPADR